MRVTHLSALQRFVEAARSEVTRVSRWLMPLINAMHQHRHEGDEYRRIELITGSRRRRQWTAEAKAAVVAESLKPGINVSALARRCGVNRALLQTWRREAMREAAAPMAAFVPIHLADG